METNTTVLVLNLAIAMVAVFSSIVGVVNMRTNGKIKVQLADAETRRISEQGDVNNTASLIGVINTVVLGLKPSTDALQTASRIMDSAGQSMNNLVTATKEVLQHAESMRTVVERRDREAEQDRKTHADNHREIIERLNKNQEQLDEVARQITILTDLPTLRSETAKILLIAAEISTNVKRLLPEEEESGEHNTPEPEAKQEISESHTEGEEKSQ